MNRHMSEQEKLADFQAHLLELLGQEIPMEEILVRLKREPAFASYREYIRTFEPRMVEVASKLVKKWGRRNS